MKWLRLYDDLLDDPKAQQLPPALFKHWINLLCLASKTEPRGTLPDMAAIAFRLRITSATARKAITDLVKAGLIDQQGETLQVHNWQDRQRPSDNVAARVRKHREAVSGNESVTLQETLPERSGNALEEDTDTDTETETNGTPSQAADAAGEETKPPRKVNGEWKPSGPAQELVVWWANYSGRGMPSMFQPAVGAAQKLIKAGLTIDTAPDLYDFCAEFQVGVTLQKMAGQYDAWRTSLVQSPGPVRPGHSPTPPAAPWPPDRELTEDEMAAAADRWLGRTGPTP